jgi:hypothetical protein
MTDNQQLRPLERRILALVHDGIDEAEIAHRFCRSAGFVKRVMDYARLPHHAAAPGAGVLRPIERRILKWRDGGVDHAEIAHRFRRSPGHIERIEQLARHKLLLAYSAG